MVIRVGTGGLCGETDADAKMPCGGSLGFCRETLTLSLASSYNKARGEAFRCLEPLIERGMTGADSGAFFKIPLLLGRYESGMVRRNINVPAGARLCLENEYM